MKLTITQEKLSKALASTSRVTSSRTQLPILNNILLRTDSTGLLVAAMNMEIAASSHIGAKITKQGSITVPARLITDFINGIKKGSVELEVKGTQLHISSGKYKATVNGMNADDFPELPAIDAKSAVTYSILSSDFKQAVSQTIITTSNDTNRPVLTGVYWHSHDGYLYLASTDGYRLSERQLVKTKSEVSAIVPKTSLQEVLRAIDDDSDTVEVMFDESQICFKTGDVEIVSQLIDGNFPDYRQLIPDKSSTNIDLNKDDFVSISKIAGLFSRDSGGSVTITTSEDNKKLLLHSIASELGENTSEIDANITGDGGKVALNSKYLIEALSVVDATDIVFSFSGKLSPCVITAKDDDINYKHIIMPLKS